MKIGKNTKQKWLIKIKSKEIKIKQDWEKNGKNMKEIKGTKIKNKEIGKK